MFNQIIVRLLSNVFVQRPLADDQHVSRTYAEVNQPCIIIDSTRSCRGHTSTHLINNEHFSMLEFYS